MRFFIAYAHVAGGVVDTGPGFGLSPIVAIRHLAGRDQHVIDGHVAAVAAAQLVDGGSLEAELADALARQDDLLPRPSRAVVPVLLTGGGPECVPALVVEPFQGQGPPVRAVHVVMKGDALRIPREPRRLQIGCPGRVVARRFHVEVVILLVGAGGSGVAGMGAAAPARPVEKGTPLDGAPALELGLEVEFVFDGVGGEDESKEEEKDRGRSGCGGMFHFGTSLGVRITDR